MTSRHPRALALVLLSSAFLTACGLKPEVRDQLAQDPAAAAGAGGVGTVVSQPGGEEVVDPTTGEPIVTAGDPAAGGTTTDPGTSSGGGGGTSSSGGGTGTSSGGGTTPTGGGGTTTAASSAPAPGPGDKGTTTGIDLKAKTVRIALHGPLTGAGVPQESFRTGTPKYWNEGPGGKPRLLKNGFRVIAEAIDDKYNAPDALRACNAAAKEFFLIVGGAGTDQIQACAQSQVLRRGNVPYLSAGVTESGLGKLPNYFATSLTYKQQGPLVVQMAKDNGFFAGKWAVIITEGPNFADALGSIRDALKASGAQFDPSKDVYLTDKAPQNCSALGSQVRGGGYNAIYFLGQPAFFAQCVGVIGAAPTYTGPGPSFGINTVARLACGAAAGQYKGVYLHPATGLDQAARRAPGVRFQDDIEYQIYGAMQGLEAAFNKVEGTLTREKFTAALRGSSIPDGIAPGASYVGDARFGGKSAFALKADCASSTYKTLKQYAK